jgi:hypothetical protein
MKSLAALEALKSIDAPGAEVRKSKDASRVVIPAGMSRLNAYISTKS